MITDVTTYYLEMTDPKDLRPSSCAYPALSIEQPPIPSPELNKFLYTGLALDRPIAMDVSGVARVGEPS